MLPFPLEMLAPGRPRPYGPPMTTPRRITTLLTSLAMGAGALALAAPAQAARPASIGIGDEQQLLDKQGDSEARRIDTGVDSFAWGG